MLFEYDLHLAVSNMTVGFSVLNGSVVLFHKEYLQNGFVITESVCLPETLSNQYSLQLVSAYSF